tara:strand:- start:2047 stop:3231 length:1185 start_codon:yes stop_codon:yes gene_type:complete
MSQESTYRSHTSIEGDLDTSVFRDMSQQEQIDRCIKMQSNDNVAYTGGVIFNPTLPSTRLATALDVLQLNAGKTALEWNSANASNATHTGQVTGSGVLTVDVTAISDQTLVTAATGDMVLIEDATDGALKRADISTFLDGVGDVTLTGTETLTNKTLVTPIIQTNILDTSGKELIDFSKATGAVNNIAIANNSTGSDPILSAIGDDTNIGLSITPKGTGRIGIAQATLSDAILGTPTSGTLTNCTGLPASGVGSGTMADARIASSNVTQHIADIKPLETIMVSLGDEDTALTASTTVRKTSIRVPWGFTASDIIASLGTAGTDATVIIDVHLNGTTIMATNKLDILTTAFVDDETATLSTTAFAKGDLLEFFIDQIGSTIAGASPTVYIMGNRT